MKNNRALDGAPFLLAISAAALLVAALPFQACMHSIGKGSWPPNAPFAGLVTFGMAITFFYAMLVDARLKMQLIALGITSLFCSLMLAFGFSTEKIGEKDGRRPVSVLEAEK